MADHNIIQKDSMADNKLSSSEEMYLVTIRMICEHCPNATIPIPDIAESLDVKPVSVNQMIKKLAEAGFVVYTPYKGVSLTEDGQEISSKILRHRRLWEVFLVRNLDMDLEKADALACHLEHLTTREVADRLSTFLDNPTVCYHGDPIYPLKHSSEKKPAVLLSNVSVGHPFQVKRVEGDEFVSSFLSDVGVKLGSNGIILAADNTGNLLLESDSGSTIRVTKEFANQIIVEEQYA